MKISSCSRKTCRWRILLLMCIRTFHYSNGTNDPRIDSEHQTLEPNCGETWEMQHREKFRKHGGNRISNSLPSENRYPWVINVIRTIDNVDHAPEELFCSGAIITKM